MLNTIVISLHPSNDPCNWDFYDLLALDNNEADTASFAIHYSGLEANRFCKVYDFAREIANSQEVDGDWVIRKFRSIMELENAEVSN